MAGLWSVILPQATTNLIKDSSFEYGTLATNWTTDVGGGTGTAALDTTKTFWGVNAVKLVGGTQYSAVYQSVTTSALTYIISAYVYTDGSAVTSADFKFVIDGAAATPDSFTSMGGGWYRAVRSQSETAAAHNTGVRALTSKTCYVDGVQFEQQTTVTTYCDGEQPGCTWSGTPHASTSSRDGGSRAGGIEYNLDTYTTYVTDVSGVGMPPMRNVAILYSVLDGAFFQTTKAEPRVIQLTVQAIGTSLDNLLNLRQSLVDACKPDAVSLPQPVLLRYAGGAKPVQISAVYDSGLDANISGTNNISETISWRFIAYDPFWQEDIEEGATVTTNASVSNANYIAQRSATGAWGALGTGGVGTLGAIGGVFALARGPNGNLYAGGGFTSMGGVANTQGIAYWDGSAWNSMYSTTAPNNRILTIAIAPNGDVYVGGLFTGINGVANTAKIAKWNGSVWSALGTGAADGVVNALTFDTSGNLYAGGSFSGMGGVANTANIAKWDGSVWTALSTGTAANVNALGWGLDGKLYIGGSFTTIAGVAANRIAKWDGGTFTALSTGLNGDCNALAIGLDGRIYATGAFTTAGGITANRIAVWNGSQWAAFEATSLNNNGNALSVAVDGTLYVGGLFNGAGGLALADGLARWNGTAWIPVDIDLPFVGAVFAFFAAADGKVTAGFNTTGSGNAANVATVTNNGKASAFPKIRLSGTGSLYQIVNYTTGDALYFKTITLLSGETITIDLSPGKKTVTSTFRGNLIDQLLPVSNLATWRLLPGANSISVFASASTLTCALYWKRRHWSLDGGN